MPKFRDISGVVFGRLVAVSRADNKNGRTVWVCRCECGNTCIVCRSNLTCGIARSCGCLRKETTARVHTKHGHAMSPEYGAWKNMIQRCQNPRLKSFKDYGGRGIKVCDSWMRLENFMNDMGSRPKGHSLDRINNSDGYHPQNCRWASRKEQQRNTRRNVIVECNGQRMTLVAWSEKTGIDRDTIENRLKKGWPVERAITAPPDDKYRNHRALKTAKRDRLWKKMGGELE